MGGRHSVTFHSFLQYLAVLVDNNSLLILFGSAYYLDTSAYTLQNEFHALDISNGYVWKSKGRLHSYLKKRDKPDNGHVIIGATFGSLIPVSF